jgi:hypothetical protein
LNRWSTRLWRKIEPEKPSINFEEWLDGRRVMDLGFQQFWAVPTNKVLTPCTDRLCVREHVKETKLIFYPTGGRSAWPGLELVADAEGRIGQRVPHVTKLCLQSTKYRQGEVLSPEDKRIWFSFSLLYRERHQFLTAAQEREKYGH